MITINDKTNWLCQRKNKSGRGDLDGMITTNQIAGLQPTTFR